MDKIIPQMCEHCDSVRVVILRHDSDWGSGNDCYLMNPESFYTKDDLEHRDNFSIECSYCLECYKYGNLMK